MLVGLFGAVGRKRACLKRSIRYSECAGGLVFNVLLLLCITCDELERNSTTIPYVNSCTPRLYLQYHYVKEAVCY